jgi:hypothetical protein
MNPRGTYLLVLLTTIFFRYHSQIIVNDFKYSGKKSPEERPYWLIGVGWNVVDDNSSAFSKIFDFVHSWNIRPYPTQLWVDRTKGGPLSFGAVFNYNQYRSGKIINGKEISGNYMFFSLDANMKYHFGQHLRIPEKYDVYLPVGAGYTLRFYPPNISTVTFNLGGGMNFWLNDWLGLNIQSVAKFGLKSPIFKTSSNYLQHSAGFIIRLGKMKQVKYPWIHARYKWVHRKRSGTERVKKF